MENFLRLMDRFFKMKVLGTLTLYEVLITIFKYLFVFLIFYFIYSIIRVIYFDVRSTMRKESITDTYLKLTNKNQGFRFKVQEFYYLTENNKIGRGEENTIIIPDKYLSTSHARIFRDDGLFFIEDLDSANGTFLNGEKINNQVELRTGDIIGMGQMEFSFVEGSDV